MRISWPSLWTWGAAHLSQREGHVSLGDPVVQRPQGVAEGEHIADGGHPSPPAGAHLHERPQAHARGDFLAEDLGNGGGRARCTQ